MHDKNNKYITGLHGGHVKGTHNSMLTLLYHSFMCFTLPYYTKLRVRVY